MSFDVQQIAASFADADGPRLNIADTQPDNEWPEECRQHVLCFRDQGAKAYGHIAAEDGKLLFWGNYDIALERLLQMLKSEIDRYIERRLAEQASQ